MLNLDQLSNVTTLAQALAAVSLLQPLYTSANTLEMLARGQLIKRVIPQLLDQYLLAGAIALPPTLNDLRVKGSDGLSQRAEVPWVRLYSQQLSPRATFGWYVVYLFAAQGQQIYLALTQGATQRIENRYVSRPELELRARIAWARKMLQAQEIQTQNCLTTIQLHSRRSALGKSYESAMIYALAYSGQQMPADETLQADLSTLLHWLSLLYQLEP